MNAGFANLATLKARLLAPSLRSDTTFDDPIQQLGLGVAAHFERFCQRKFARLVGATETFAADYTQFFLSRTPIEALTRIELRLTYKEGWVEQTVEDFITSLNEQSGVVHLPDSADPGPPSAQLRFTYTGGYWWATAEPDDEGEDEQPAGSTALPDDLKEAWLLTCESLWKSRDKLGTEIVEGDNTKFAQSLISEIKLSPLVQQMLQPHVRMVLV